MSIGRGVERDLRVMDISVSRLHCTLSTYNNKLYLIDNSSKFGTLLRIKGNTTLKM